MPVGGDIEAAVGSKLHQVQRGQVAGRVVNEHVLGARVRGVDAGRVPRRVPAVDRGVVLHAGIAALPSSFGNFMEQFASLVRADHVAADDRCVLKSASRKNGVHEFVADADELLAFWKKIGRVGF